MNQTALKLNLHYNRMSKQEIELLQRALDRQVKARKEAEKILESKSKELYDTLHYLKEDNNRLKGLLQEKNIRA